MRKNKIGKNGILIIGMILFFVLLDLALFLFRSAGESNDQSLEILPDNVYERTLVAVADRDYEPYSFCEEGRAPSGYDIELLYAVANHMGVNVEVRLMDWTGCKEAIISGEADLITGLDYQLNGNPNILRSMAMYNDRFVCFGEERINNVRELYGKRLAALEQSGSIVEFLAPYGLMENTTLYPSYTEVFRSVAEGENDYAIARYSVGRRLVAKLGDTAIGAVGPSLANNSMCIGLNKDNEELLEPLNAAIMAVIRDGTMDWLSGKWLGTYVELISFQDFLRVYSNHILLFTLVLLVLLSAATMFIFRSRTQAIRSEHEATTRTLEYQTLIAEATKGLYDDIYELDLTHNRAVGDATKRYFEQLGMPGDIPFDEALRGIAKKRIKREYWEGYWDTFMPQNAIAAYNQGISSFAYECLMSSDGEHYYWMRIVGRLFFWEADGSVRMITYRQNIDMEKRRETRLLEQVQKDAMTGIYNKVSMENLVEELLANPARGNERHVLLIIDIDRFKQINDSLGHSAGDAIILECVGRIRSNLRKTDLVGRIGGDEFAVLLRNVPDEAWLERKLTTLNRALAEDCAVEGSVCSVSASIGAALTSPTANSYYRLFQHADKALYDTKRNGRNGYTVYSE